MIPTITLLYYILFGSGVQSAHSSTIAGIVLKTILQVEKESRRQASCRSPVRATR